MLPLHQQAGRLPIKMTALPPPMIPRAMSAHGLPICGEADASGNQERLQMDGMHIVDSAGQAYAVNGNGISMDNATTPVSVPQPGNATRQRDLVMQYWAGAPPAAITVLPVFALNPGQVAMTTIIDYNSSEGHPVFCKGT
jgi:hypothetical protein